MSVISIIMICTILLNSSVKSGITCVQTTAAIDSTMTAVSFLMSICCASWSMCYKYVRTAVIVTIVIYIYIYIYIIKCMYTVFDNLLVDSIIFCDCS